MKLQFIVFTSAGIAHSYCDNVLRRNVPQARQRGSRKQEPQHRRNKHLRRSSTLRARSPICPPQERSRSASNRAAPRLDTPARPSARHQHPPRPSRPLALSNDPLRHERGRDVETELPHDDDPARKYASREWIDNRSFQPASEYHKHIAVRMLSDFCEYEWRALPAVAVDRRHYAICVRPPDRMAVRTAETCFQEESSQQGQAI